MGDMVGAGGMIPGSFVGVEDAGASMLGGVVAFSLLALFGCLRYIKSFTIIITVLTSLSVCCSPDQNANICRRKVFRN